MSIDFQKFSRQLILPDFGKIAQEKLASSKVLIIGAGGLGCPVIQYLAAVGIGTIGIIDNDIVSRSNLPRQILFTENDIDKKKIAVLKQHFKTTTNHFIFLEENLNVNNALQVINDFDVVVDTTDNFETRYLVNDYCVLLNKILVSASIHQYHGQLGVFNYLINNTQRSATYRCLFPEAPIDSLNCSEAGILSTVAGVMGTMQAHEVVKVIAGLGDVLFNKLLIWNGKTMQQNILQFERDEEAVKKLLQNGLANNYSIDSFCKSRPTTLMDISVEDLNKKIIAQEKFQLIDIREEFERDEFNIGGEWIAMNDLLKNPKKISTAMPVILYCKKGERSKIVQQRLSEKYQFTHIINLKGGIDAWRKAFNY